EYPPPPGISGLDFDTSPPPKPPPPPPESQLPPPPPNPPLTLLNGRPVL
uniref:Uncharacterized protein n=1 Tax=Amphimedon queenslandica TaxID=400682 RepID=A0A1X7TPL2_AMPQE